MRGTLLAALLVLCLSSRPTPLTAQSVVQTPATPASFDTAVKPVLANYCVKCHGKEKPEGDLRLDGLSVAMKSAEERKKWRGVLTRVHAQEMPPKKHQQPTAEEAKQFTAWIEKELHAIELAERKENGRVVRRRMNRTEYENTICDLLGIRTDLKEMLALDGSTDGFDNIGSSLQLSSFALQRYMEANNKALNLAIANAPQPPLVKKRYDLKKQQFYKSSTEKVYRELDEGLVLFSSSAWNQAWPSEFYPSHGGLYRIRISAQAVQSNKKPVTYRVSSGALRGKDGLIGYFDAPPEKPEVAEVIVRLEPRAGIYVLPYGLAGAQAVHKTGADKSEGPGVAIHWIEAEGPLHEAWPPPSHKALFGDLTQKKMPHNQISEYREVISEKPDEDAKKILTQFLRRAFRRSVSEKDVQPYLKLFQKTLKQDRTFEESLRVALNAALVSEDFLFLKESPGVLSEFALASRLSYFLWSSMPDDTLLSLAEEKKLRDPKVLREQVERMLKSAKASNFTDNFVGQWLGLRNIDFTEPNVLLYPEFDHMLKVSMLRETELFFEEVLKNDLSLLNFVDSDFSMLNGRLARHYGIEGPEGWAFKKVALPKDSHRGGVMTMASVLKVTANGSYTHPVHRGVWVLERILGQRPPNPPADVPVIEPDIRGAKGTRELLAKHKQGSCASCHAAIDPPGFALENFDVIGGWRENYRSQGNGKAVVINGQTQRYRAGPAVEAGDTMKDGRKFANIDEFKKLLLEDKDQIARALTIKLVTYATGAPPEPMDKEEIEKLVRASKEQKYGFKSLIHAIVQSPLFQEK